MALRYHGKALQLKGMLDIRYILHLDATYKLGCVAMFLLFPA